MALLKVRLPWKLLRFSSVSRSHGGMYVDLSRFRAVSVVESAFPDGPVADSAKFSQIATFENIKWLSGRSQTGRRASLL